MLYNIKKQQNAKNTPILLLTDSSPVKHESKIKTPMTSWLK